MFAKALPGRGWLPHDEDYALVAPLVSRCRRGSGAGRGDAGVAPDYHRLDMTPDGFLA